MIERVYLKNYVTFEEVELEFGEVELEFSKGLIVFTGPSGAGKSVLMRGILSIFGFFDINAKVGEATVTNKIDLEKYGLENDNELIFRQIKKNKNRYFINNQAVSKKVMRKISEEFIDYLSLREIKEFESVNILNVLDKMVKEKDYYVKLEEYKKLFNKYKIKQKKLEDLIESEKNVSERKEFLKYEIEKIKSIDPKPEEFDKLMKIKKDLSKLEKIKEKSYEIENIFNYEHTIYEFLDMLEIESEFFSNTMNELRLTLEKANEKAEFLENVNIEEVLDRLSKLQELIRRFGSIEEAMEYVKEKETEFENLQNLSFEKENLQKEIKEIENKLLKLAEYIHTKRVKVSKDFIKKLNYFLKKLYMPEAKIEINKTALNDIGMDSAEIIVNDIDINDISTGEFNRLRIALLGAKLEYSDEEKTLFLDEIDANLSGEESMSVAEVLKLLSKKYQIFSISHQPQLASVADKHFLVTKNKNQSFVKELDNKERIAEIARIIGGKEKSLKAIEYAKELLGDKNG